MFGFAVQAWQVSQDRFAQAHTGCSGQQDNRGHPLVVLFSIVAGGALFGIAGTILAVPLTAMAVNVLAEARATEAAEAPVAAEDGAGA